MTKAEFARPPGISSNRVNIIVKGKRGISAETVILFSQAFGTMPDFWLNIQRATDLYNAQSTKKVKRLNHAARLSKKVKSL